MIQLERHLAHPAPRLSICCGYSPDREYLLARSVAEMRSELRGLPVEYLAARLWDEEWNECKCKNTAARYAQASVLLFTNCDIVIPRFVPLAICERPKVLDGMLVQCYRRDEQPDGSWQDNFHALGDCQIVPKDLWQAAQGFDERMTGWGYLDYDFAERVRIAGGVPVQPPRKDKIFVRHHWHPRLTDEQYRAMNQRNQEIALCPPPS